MNKVRVTTKSLCFTDKLGSDFELPETPELCDAIMVINKACSDEVKRRDKDIPFLEAFATFKWDAVQSVMVQLNWRWRDGAVPNIKQMKEHVKYLYKSLDSNETDNISSGGFTVTRNEDEVVIEFSISSYGFIE